MLVVLVTVYLTLYGFPCVDSTFAWVRRITLRRSRPEICEMKLVAGNQTFHPSVLLDRNFNLQDYKLVLPEDDAEVGPYAHVHSLHPIDPTG